MRNRPGNHNSPVLRHEGLIFHGFFFWFWVVGDIFFVKSARNQHNNHAKLTNFCCQEGRYLRRVPKDRRMSSIKHPKIWTNERTKYFYTTLSLHIIPEHTCCISWLSRYAARCLSFFVDGWLFQVKWSPPTVCGPPFIHPCRKYIQHRANITPKLLYNYIINPKICDLLIDSIQEVSILRGNDW